MLRSHVNDRAEWSLWPLMQRTGLGPDVDVESGGEPGPGLFQFTVHSSLPGPLRTVLLHSRFPVRGATFSPRSCCDT